MDWVAISGSIIALAALGLAIYEGRQNRKHNRLSVRPEIISRRGTPKDNRLFYSIANAGLGPAKIISMTFRLDGEPLDGDTEQQLDKAIKVCFTDIPTTSVTSGVVNPGYVIEAGERIVILDVEWIPGSKQEQIVKAAVNRVDVRVDYQSLYSEPGYFDSAE